MRGGFTFLILLVAGSGAAQPSAHLGVHLEVLPPALRVTVTSARIDFGQQRANAGHVVLDATTGEISTKAAGRHQVGQLQLTGRAGAPYTVDVAAVPYLRSLRRQSNIRFGVRWAQREDCSEGGFEQIPRHQAVSGRVGRSGCSMLRFGGTIALHNAAEGRYEGRLHVRIVL